MQLARILDQHDPVVSFRNFGQQGVDQRGLAGGRAPRDQDIFTVRNCLAQICRLPFCHDPGSDIIVEREDRDGGFTDRKARGHHHG